MWFRSALRMLGGRQFQKIRNAPRMFWDNSQRAPNVDSVRVVNMISERVANVSAPTVSKDSQRAPNVFSARCEYYQHIRGALRIFWNCWHGIRPPPRPQTLHRSHDNLKNPYRIASIFYMYIDIGERMPGKQDGPSLIIYGPPSPPPPPNSPKCEFFHIGAHIWKTGDYFFSLVIN